MLRPAATSSRTRGPSAIASAAGALAVGLGLGALVLVAPSLPVVAGGVLAALALLVASPLRPIRLLYGLVVLVPLTSAMPRGQIVPLAVPNELLLLAVAALGVVWASLSRGTRPLPGSAWASVSVFVVGITVVPVLAYVARDVPLSTAGIMNLVAPLQYPLLFWLFAAVPRGEGERRVVLQLMIAAGSVVAAIGLLQAFGVGAVSAFLDTWYPSGHTTHAAEYGRVTSVLGAWNALGLFLLTVLLLVAAIYPEERRGWARRNMQVATALAVLCLIATNLYSGIIGAIVGFVLVKRLDPRGLRSVVPVAVVAAIGVAVLLPDLLQRADFQARDDSWIPQTLVYRWWVWESFYFGPIAESPVWGVLPTFDHLGFSSPESQYVYLLFRSGAVSLLAHVVWLAVLVGWMLRHVRRRDGASPLGRTVAIVVLGLTAVYSLIGFINPVFTYSVSMAYFWILVALVANDGRDRDDDLGEA